MVKKDIKQEIIDALNRKVRITKKIHRGWEDMERLKKLDPHYKQWFGKYQYFYESPKGKIDLIKLLDYYSDGVDWWELYCEDKKLVPSETMRFRTKKEAETFIISLLAC